MEPVDLTIPAVGDRPNGTILALGYPRTETGVQSIFLGVEPPVPGKPDAEDLPTPGKTAPDPFLPVFAYIRDRKAPHPSLQLHPRQLHHERILLSRSPHEQGQRHPRRSLQNQVRLLGPISVHRQNVVSHSQPGGLSRAVGRQGPDDHRRAAPVRAHVPSLHHPDSDPFSPGAEGNRLLRHDVQRQFRSQPAKSRTHIRTRVEQRTSFVQVQYTPRRGRPDAAVGAFQNPVDGPGKILFHGENPGPDSLVEPVDTPV